MHGESAASLESDFSEGLGVKRCEVEDPEFDVTAMVDLVSLMNIYFLVAWVVAMSNEVDMPPSKHSIAGDPESSVIVTIKKGEQAGLKVVIGDDPDVAPITDRAEILRQVEAAVKDGSKKAKDCLLLKAEKEIQMKDIAFISGAVAAAEGFKLRLGVLEQDK